MLAEYSIFPDEKLVSTAVTAPENTAGARLF